MVPKSNEVNLPESVPNPLYAPLVDNCAKQHGYPNNGMKMRVPMERRCVYSVRQDYFFFSHVVVSSRYYAKTTSVNWPPEVRDYNVRFTKILNAIKKRHDPTVTTVAQGVLEWKRSQNARSIGLDIQAWLDRFYMSRIGIRFLIGQRESPILPLFIEFHYYYI